MRASRAYGEVYVTYSFIAISNAPCRQDDTVSPVGDAPSAYAPNKPCALWRSQGKLQQARELLAPVYGWFLRGSIRATSTVAAGSLAGAGHDLRFGKEKAPRTQRGLRVWLKRLTAAVWRAALVLARVLSWGRSPNQHAANMAINGVGIRLAFGASSGVAVAFA